jgi:hypothetical protein
VRVRSVLVGALLVLGGAGCGIADEVPVRDVTSAPAADRVYLMECVEDQLVQQPASFTLACADAGESLDALEWQDWGADNATATGQVVVTDCEPDCANGTLKRYDVRVVADRLVAGEALQTYGRLRVTPTGDKPDFWHATETYRLPTVESAG